jgi:Ca2+-binding RTX toxin-like protein
MAFRPGTSFADFLIGSADADLLLGFGDDDSLFGLGGDDLFFGGTGNDLLEGDSIPPNVRLLLPVGEPGNDTLFGGAGDDTLGGDEGADILDGAEGADLLDGGAGDDVLHGGFSLGDTDTLVGGAGSDDMAGGGGTDLFRFAAGDLPGTQSDPDRISDFQTAAIINILPDRDSLEFDTATGSGSLTEVAQAGDTRTYLVEDGLGTDLGYLAVTTVSGLPLVAGLDYTFA